MQHLLQITLFAAVTLIAAADYAPLDPAKLALLPKECGVTKLGRTTNSTKSLVYEFPWMAIVRFKNLRRPATCFGTLINRRYVLSVIGCVRKTKREPDYVRLGEHSALTDEDCNVVQDPATGNEVRDCAGPVVDIPIERMIWHPQFDDPMYTNDIALIRMQREVQYNDYIRPICLPTTPKLRTNVPNNLVLSAWEIDPNVPTHYVAALEKYYMKTVTLEECQVRYEIAGFNTEIEDKERMCALQLGPNYVCTRMAGAPIGTEMDVEGTTRFVQYGIAKFAPLNCTVRETTPIIGMKVTEYMDWIMDHLEA